MAGPLIERAGKHRLELGAILSVRVAVPECVQIACCAPALDDHEVIRATIFLDEEGDLTTQPPLFCLNLLDEQRGSICGLSWLKIDIEDDLNLIQRRVRCLSLCCCEQKSPGYYSGKYAHAFSPSLCRAMMVHAPAIVPLPKSESTKKIRAYGNCSESTEKSPPEGGSNHQGGN